MKIWIYWHVSNSWILYMINRLWYCIFHITCHINPRLILVFGPLVLELIWTYICNTGPHFKNTQVKHNWIPFFFSKQNAMIDIADRLFKSVSNHGKLTYVIPVLTMSTGPPAQDQKNVFLTSKFFSFYLDIYI
jgi:hypothetical protein